MTTKTKILFVDDEVNVLAAIKRMLRKKLNDWDLSFAESGVDALALFEGNSFDVVVSDIKMPGMDGAELLTRIKDEHPGVIRIAFSGQVDLEEVMRSVNAVHQYISKPCEAEKLIGRIEGALKSKELLTDQKLIHLVTEIESLPVLPRVLREVENELGKEEPSLEIIAELITQDIGLVTKILKLVNSPFFGVPAQIESIYKAITMLGLDTIKSLILSTHLFALYNDKVLPNYSLNMLWEHCFRVSNIARLIAECEGADKKTVTESRMAGLLHDVGKLILINYFPQKYAEVLTMVEKGTAPICELEKSVFGTTHAEIGAYLMGLWGVPGNVVHGIGFHHEYESLDMSVAMFLSLANVIDHNFVVINDNYARIKFKPNLASIICDDTKIRKWLKYIDEHWSDDDTYSFLDDGKVNMLFSQGGACET
ncbi:response regulator [Pseudodesulfovibrio sp.]|nr:response regulator [Pseudodesulfovibrio sp.]